MPDVSSHICSEAALSVSQLVMFNAVKHRRHPPADKPQGPLTVRHYSGTETPLPIYINWSCVAFGNEDGMVWYTRV